MKYAKAHGASDRSDSIIVSFDSVWHPKLRQSEFSVIIRKRTPTSATPRWLYFHINAPISKICGRAEIHSIKNIDKRRALDLSKTIGMAPAAIAAYIAGESSIGAYFIGKIELPEIGVSTFSIQEHLSYSPPQSFLFLSHEGKEVIDRLCRFNRCNHSSSE